MEDKNRSVVISRDQHQVIETIFKGQGNFLVTGPSGSGKTEVLKELAARLSQSGYRVLSCALTGMAAENCTGVTLHSAMKLPLNLIQNGSLVEIDPEILQDIDLVLIDSAHSLSPILLDILWEAFQKARPLGPGCRLVLFADFYALPPIMQTWEQDAYKELTGATAAPRFTFQASHWGDFEFTHLELTDILRAGNAGYREAISRLRMGDSTGILCVQNLVSKTPVQDAPWLYPTRDTAREKNTEYVNALPQKAWRLLGTVTGKAPDEWLPVPNPLVLKVGMPVAMAANHPKGYYRNGSRGTIQNIEDKENGIAIYVVFPGTNGRVRVNTYQWDYVDSSGLAGTYTQYPIMAGYAFSAHQAASMQLDAVNISGTCRMHGQLYTMLSRCMEPSRIYLEMKKPLEQLKVSRAVHRWEQENGNDFYLQGLDRAALVAPRTSIPSDGYRNGMRFGTTAVHIDYNGQRLVRTYIVLRNADKKICCLTNYTSYIKYGKGRIDSDIGHAAYFIVSFLNYVFIDAFSINCLQDVTIEHLRSFVHAYGTGSYGSGRRTQETFHKGMSLLIRFVHELLKDKKLSMLLKEEDLFTEHVSLGKKGARIYYKTALSFPLTYDPDSNFILRDIPEAALRILLSRACRDYPQILMNIALSICGGLRPSETCSLRMGDLKVTEGPEGLTSVTVDLEHERPLRGDGRVTGGIKKHRTVRIHKTFLPLFTSLYKKYMPWRRSHSIDPLYDPLCVDNGGLAMTYQFYYRKFKELVDDTLPDLLQDPDPNIREYGKILAAEGIAPHILRHVFTTMLVRLGFNQYQIMNLRGDSSPESAIAYIARKSDLAKIYSQWVDDLVQALGTTAPKGRKNNEKEKG